MGKSNYVMKKGDTMAQFTNRAQLSYNDTTVNSNLAVGEILEILSVTKTAVTTDYATGEDVTYVVSLINSGSTALTGVSVTDDLGGYPFGTQVLYPLAYVEGSVRLYINGVLQAPPTVTAGPPLAFSGFSLPAGSNAILVYEADVTRFAPLGTDASIVNTATVSATGIATPVTDTETVTPVAEPSLTITKSVEPTTVAENGTLTYTFVIRNYGNTAAEADANATVTDTFDPVLSEITVTLDGTPLAEGTGYTYVQTAGEFATVPGVITVPAATYAQDPITGAWSITPGETTLTVSGTL